jgi:ethanolamine utilization protein EutA
MGPRDKNAKSTPAGHSIADHLLGALAGHVHAPGEAHDHDHDHDALDLLPDGASTDVVLTSIGIDVGSSGTQVAIARLTLERDRLAVRPGKKDGAALHLVRPRSEVVYQSPIYLTPYAAGDRIDEAALGRLVDHALESAEIGPDAIDCGVVILTGAARERVNAAAIGATLAERCGDIVSAAAGHHMEARLAAHGSGAVARSAEFGQRYLVVDIGGATTKLAVCEMGEVTASAALAIGGRLVVTDKSDIITRLEPWGQRHAARAGLSWEAGGKAPWSERQDVARDMADQLVARIASTERARDDDPLWLTEPMRGLEGIDGVIFSGGVGEYVYGRETRSFGDIGLPLGRALARRIDAGALPWPLLPASECIRASVVGASAHSVQLSGRTGYISNPGVLLPQRNLPVVAIDCEADDRLDAAALAQTISEHLARRDLTAIDAGPGPVLAIGWAGAPEHARLLALAKGIQRGFASRIADGQALYVTVDADIAASLGAILREELGIINDLLVLDGIKPTELDFIDLGRLRLPSSTVPVTIKSLAFRDEAGREARPRSAPAARRRASRGEGGRGP